MTVSFNQVPSNLRVPFVTAEFDSSQASQGPALMAYRGLLIGQKINGASAAANSLHRITNADDVLDLCGRGSIAHLMARAWYAENNQTELRVLVLADSSSGAYATGSIVVTGTATEDGTLHIYLGGKHVEVAVSNGDSASTVATAIAAAIGKRASATVTFASATSGDNITVGGTSFVASSGAVTPGAATYSYDTGNNETATSFAAQVNAHATASQLVRATASGAVVTLRAYAGGTDGESVIFTSVDGVTTAVTGSGTLIGSTEDTDCPVHAYSSSGTVTLVAKNAGLHANEIDLRINYRSASEETPAGLSIAITAMSGGTTNPTLTSGIAALGDLQFHIVAHPYTDATSLTAIENELSSRFGPMRMIDGLAITAKSASYSTVASLGEGRNSPHSCILRTNDSPTTPAEYAASVAGVVARYGADDPARPFQTLPLTHVLAPAETDRDTLTERNLLLFDGIATTTVGPGDVVQIERLITTYQQNASGVDDTAYLDANTLLTLMYLRFSWRARVSSRFPRHKLANDGTRVPSGQAIVTPKIMKAEAVAWFEQMIDLGLVEDLAQFKKDMIVERNASNANRIDLTLPANLINQLMVTAGQVPFRI